MKLFIANATRQNYDFVYRVPEVVGLRSQFIPMGGQIEVSGDLNQPQIDDIIKQYEKYGLVPIDEVGRVRRFSGLCYSVGKQIRPDAIERLMRHNNQALVERGRKIREETAVAQNNALENMIEESGRPETLSRFEMSVVEENPDEREESEPIAEGIRVTRQGGAEPPARRGGRRAAA